MTRETKWLLALDEIQIVRLQCKNQECRATFGFELRHWKGTSPPKCPECGHQWMLVDSAAQKAVSALRNAIQDLSKENDSLGCKISLEIEGNFDAKP